MPKLAFAAPYVVSASLIIVGVIHLLPLAGLLGTDRLAVLYGIAVDETNLAILMRHRAALFGLLGGFMVYAAARPALQSIALLGGFISLASFLWLACATGGYNAQLGRVFAIDCVALGLVLTGAVFKLLSTNAP